MEEIKEYQQYLSDRILSLQMAYDRYKAEEDTQIEGIDIKSSYSSIAAHILDSIVELQSALDLFNKLFTTKPVIS